MLECSPVARSLCVDVTCASWLEVQQMGTACTKQFWTQVYTLMERVRTAEESGVLAQLEVFLHLFLLRELLDAVRIDSSADDMYGSSAGTLDSPRMGTQSLEQSCTPSDSSPSSSLPPLPSCSFFCRFLVWAYGDVEARTRYNQLQRLANWFRVSTDVDFFRRLCNGSITPQKKPSAAAAAALAPLEGKAASTTVSQEKNKLRQPRLCPLSITYFYLLSPRLPHLQCQFGDGVTPEMEARLISYLSVRPLLLFQQRLATDFGLTKRVGPGQSMVIKSDPVVSLTVGGAPLVSAMSVLSEVALDEDASTDAKAAGSFESREASSAEVLLESMAKASADGNTAHTSSDAEPEDNFMQPEADQSESDEQDEDAPPAQFGGAREVSTRQTHAAPRSSRKDKRKREPSPSHITQVAAGASARPKARAAPAASAASIPPAPIDILCLSVRAVPVELLLLGVSTWLRKRQQSSEPAPHRQAMDGALTDLMWELSEALTDGDRLLVPEFKQARRSASRAASANYHHSVEGERGCNLLHTVLEKLMQAAPSNPPHSSTL